mgnify:FL=1
MANARKVVPLIYYDGKEVGLTERAESIEYTDNDQGKSDEITITFAGSAASWMAMSTAIEKEHNLEVALTFAYWDSPETFSNYHAGNFTVDDITFSGPPSVCVVKGISIPASSDFTSTKRSKVWNNVTLKQIAQEKMAEYGMTNLFYYGAEPVIEVVEQADQTDSEFLYDLCKHEGMFLKIYKVGFVIFDKKIYEARGCKAEFTIDDMESYSWNSTLVGTYTGATVQYTNTDAKKNTAKKTKTKKAAAKAVKANNTAIEARDPNSYNVGKVNTAAEKKMISLLVGTGPRIMQINEHCENEAEAMRKAAAKVNEENEKAVTIEFTTIGNCDAELYATDNFMISGMGRMDGKYFCTSVTHSVNGGSGHKMIVKGYKIFNRL